RRCRHFQFEHETIARSRSELERFFPLHPVAIREHDHVRKTELAAEGGHRALGHRAQQERLHLRTRSVDLVEEERGQALAVPQERPWLDPRFSSGIDVGVVHEIAWHEVDRALDTLELAPERTRESSQNRRLADT